MNSRLAEVLAPPIDRLRHLYLYDASLSHEDVAELARALRRNKSLESLDLGCNSISSIGALLDALKRNTTLAELELHENEIGATEAKKFVSFLSVNTGLETLVLTNNDIGDGARWLAEGLRRNCTLTMLYLNYNNIGHAGALALAEALLVNKTLEQIDLCGNPIGDSGVEALANALKRNRTLTDLQIADTNLRTTDAIANMLRCNNTLQWLNVAGNPIDLDSLHAAALFTNVEILESEYEEQWHGGPRNLGRFEMEAFVGAENQDTQAGRFVRACGDRAVLHWVLEFLIGR